MLKGGLILILKNRKMKNRNLFKLSIHIFFMDYEIKYRKYEDSRVNVNKLESRLRMYSLKSLDSQVFETPAVCH